MKSKIFSILLSLVFALTTVLPVLAAPPVAPVEAPPAAPAFVPSTPENNKLKGWAYHEVVPVPGGVEITLYAPRNFWSCIEYRADDEAPQDPNHPYLVLSPLLADGQFRDLCGRGDILPVQTIFVAAGSHVDIRMSYGAEGNERYYGWLRYSAGPAIAAGSSNAKSEDGPEPNELCHITFAPIWVPYDKYGVSIGWDINGRGCSFFVTPVSDNSIHYELVISSADYPGESVGWVGRVYAPPIPSGWYIITSNGGGSAGPVVWVGNSFPSNPYSGN